MYKKTDFIVKGILVIVQPELGLTSAQSRTWSWTSRLTETPSPGPGDIGKQGRETNRSLWALGGLRPIQIISLSPRQQGGQGLRREKIKQRREDEKKKERLRGRVGPRHKNKYGMWRKGRREEILRSFRCVCVCVRLSVTVSQRVIVCASRSLSVHLCVCVRTHGRICMLVRCGEGAGERGGGSNQERDMI